MIMNSIIANDAGTVDKTSSANAGASKKSKNSNDFAEYMSGGPQGSGSTSGVQADDHSQAASESDAVADAQDGRAGALAEIQETAGQEGTDQDGADAVSDPASVPGASFPDELADEKSLTANTGTEGSLADTASVEGIAADGDASEAENTESRGNGSSRGAEVQFADGRQQGASARTGSEQSAAPAKEQSAASVKDAETAGVRADKPGQTASPAVEPANRQNRQLPAQASPAAVEARAAAEAKAPASAVKMPLPDQAAARASAASGREGTLVPDQASPRPTVESAQASLTAQKAAAAAQPGQRTLSVPERREAGNEAALISLARKTDERVPETQAGVQIRAAAQQTAVSAVALAQAQAISGVTAAAGSDLLSGSAEFQPGLHGLSGEAPGLTQLLTEASAGASAAHRPETPRMIAAQMANAFAAKGEPKVEISLNPQELGHVKMRVSASETGITMIIQTERPETGDLMRRHINELAEEFRRMGYEDISFEFSGGHSGGSGPGEGAEDSHMPGRGSGTATSGNAQDTDDQAMQNLRHGSAGVDMRV